MGLLRKNNEIKYDKILLIKKQLESIKCGSFFWGDESSPPRHTGIV
jgi:hypothetical protein